MDNTQISQMYTILQHKGIIHVAASAAFVVVGWTLALLGGVDIARCEWTHLT
jgi:hypothetical protein